MIMKSKFIIFSILVILFAACEKPNIPENPGDNDSTDTISEKVDGPYAIMTIVKFENPELQNKIIVQHQIAEDGSTLENAIYEEDKDLSLNFYNIWPAVIPFAEQKISIVGTSPYIPLTEGYYMIDWKWHQFMPLCSFNQACREAYQRHIEDHVFMTDINWQAMTSITDKYDHTKYTQHIGDIELKKVSYWDVDLLYEDKKPKQGGPYYSCYGDGIYAYNGMCASTAWEYYSNGPCSYHPQETWQSYIHYCDSLQAIYQQRMIEIITKGQLEKVIFKW